MSSARRWYVALICSTCYTQSYRALTVDPSLVFSFLDVVVQTLQDYLGEISPASLKDNFDVVYQVRHDYGFMTITQCQHIILVTRGDA